MRPSGQAFRRTTRAAVRAGILASFGAGALFASCKPRALAVPPVTPPAPAPVAPRQVQTTTPPEEPEPQASDCGLPAALLERGWARRLEPSASGDVRLPPEGTRTIVVLPDTQYYSACRSHYLADQVAYVLQQRERRNIVVVLTVGDLTDHNEPEEWEFFASAVAPLGDAVPLVLTTGNHDHGPHGTARVRGSGFQATFPTLAKKSAAHVAETLAPDDYENAYYRIPFGRSTLGVLSLEWSPRERTVTWARAVLDRHPGDRALLATHAYLYFDDTRYDWDKYGLGQEWNPRAYGTARIDPDAEPGAGDWQPEGAYDGEMLWQGLVRSRPSFWLTVSGHVLGDGQGRLTSRGDHGNSVHQLLVNYQMLEAGGSGYLRLLEVSPDGAWLRAFTYSPSLNRRATAPDQEFELAIEPPL